MASTDFCTLQISKWARLRYLLESEDFKITLAKHPKMSLVIDSWVKDTSKHAMIYAWYNKHKTLDELTLLEIKRIAKTIGIPNVSRMFRADLIQRIKDFYYAEEKQSKEHCSAGEN